MMITYEDYFSDNEMEALDSLTHIIQNNKSFQYVLNPIERHSDFSTPSDFKKNMRTLFKGYKFPGTDVPQDLATIENYYQKISQKYDFEIKIPEHGLVFEGDKFVRLRTLKNRISRIKR